MRTSDGGKGDTPREVNQQKFNENWDRIFGKKESVLVNQQFIDKWHLQDKIDQEENT